MNIISKNCVGCIHVNICPGAKTKDNYCANKSTKRTKINR